MKTPLGITYVVPDGQSPTGIYDSESGIEAFESDAPYMAGGSDALTSPLPVFDAGGPVFQDAMGNAYQALPVKGVTPPEPDPDGITWDNNTTWDNGTYWS